MCRAVFGQVRIAHQLVQVPSLDGGGALGGQREQDGVLAFTKVVQDGFAGLVRVAVYAQQVVAELEGFPQRQREGRQGLMEGGFGSCEDGPGVQGTLNGVFRSLVPDHA